MSGGGGRLVHSTVTVGLVAQKVFDCRWRRKGCFRETLPCRLDQQSRAGGLESI